MTTQEQLKDWVIFLGLLAKKGLKASKILARTVVKNSGRILELGANIGTAFAPRSAKAVSSTPPDLIIFFNRKRVISRKNCSSFCPSKRLHLP